MWQAGRGVYQANINVSEFLSRKIGVRSAVPPHRRHEAHGPAVPSGRRIRPHPKPGPLSISERNPCGPCPQNHAQYCPFLIQKVVKGRALFRGLWSKRE